MIKTFKGDTYEAVDKDFEQYETTEHIEVIHMCRYADHIGNHYLSIYYKPKHFTI